MRRLRHVWTLLKTSGIARVFAGIYAALGLATFVRDNLLPPELRARFDTYGILTLLPTWSSGWFYWVIGGLVVTVIALVEGSFRLDAHRAEDLARVRGLSDQRYTRLCDLQGDAYQLIQKHHDRHTTADYIEFRADHAAFVGRIRDHLVPYLFPHESTRLLAFALALPEPFEPETQERYDWGRARLQEMSSHIDRFIRDGTPANLGSIEAKAASSTGRSNRS